MTIVLAYVNVTSSQLDFYRRKLEKAAYNDALTGIGNRRYLPEKAKMFFAKEQTGVILLVDIDNFKKVNDTYGHDVGDEVLRSMYSAISKYERQNGISARFGGKEFVILLPGCELDVALIKTETIRQAVKQIEITTHDNMLHITASLGIYEIKKEDSFENSIKRADIALYQAKENGKDRIEVY